MGHEVLWVGKRDSKVAFEMVACIAGVNPDGSVWKLSHQQAIEGIESGRWQFFADVPGSGRTWLTVSRDAFGQKHLKAESDSVVAPISLLTLADLPQSS